MIQTKKTQNPSKPSQASKPIVAPQKITSKPANSIAQAKDIKGQPTSKPSFSTNKPTGSSQLKTSQATSPKPNIPAKIPKITYHNPSLGSS